MSLVAFITEIDEPVTKILSSLFFPVIPYTKYLLNNYNMSGTMLEAVYCLMAILRGLIFHFGSWLQHIST